MPIGGGINYGALDNTDATSPVCRAGTLRYDRQSGNTYVYLQASAAITVGQVLTPFHQSGDGPGVAINSVTTSTAPAAGDTQITSNASDFTVTSDGMIGSTAIGVENGHILRWLFDTDQTGMGQHGIVTRRIGDTVVDIYVEGQGTSVSSDGTLAAGTASQTFIMTTNTRVEATGLVTDRAIAVAQFAVPDERWFWGLYVGTGLAKLDASLSAIVATNGILLPAASGMCEGATAPVTAPEAIAAFGYSHIDVDGSPDNLIPVTVDCSRLWPNPGGHGSPNRRGISYPGWWKQ